MKYVLALDAGTTGVTALAVGTDARIHATGYREFPQYFPQPGWVDHDVEEIWNATVEAASEVLDKVDRDSVVAIGITNQRETAVLWDRTTSDPIAKADGLAVPPDGRPLRRAAVRRPRAAYPRTHGPRR